VDLKKGFAVSFLLLPFIFTGAACKQSISGLGIQLELERKTLSNGLSVIMVEDHTVPIISYQTWYRAGSVDEHPGITGVSHLFEHLMFKGTPKYGPKRFFQELETKGAQVNAFTTRDYTVYYETIVPSLLEKVIDMESDRMANLELNEEILNSERMVVLEERRLRAENSPEGKIQEALWQLSYRRHPYQWPVIGYSQDLLSISLEQVKEFFKTHYQPANATIVIVGDFKTEAAYPLIKKYYERIPSKGKVKRKIQEEPEQQEERRLTLRDHVLSERFAQAYHITAATNDDSYALDVLANILFEGTSSRAYRRLVEEKELAIAVTGSAYTPTYPGLFIIAGVMKEAVQSGEAEAALDELIREIQDPNSVISDQEIRVAVRQLTVQLVDSVRSPHGLGQLIGTVQTIFGDPQRFASDLAKYFRVTAPDVKRVAQKYLIPNNRSVVILAPGSERKK